MLRLKAHDKPINEYTQIDKFLLVPKKLWNYFEKGENELRLNNQKLRTRIYEIPCDCVLPRHSHRIIDLRESWEKLKLSNGQEVEVTK